MPVGYAVEIPCGTLHRNQWYELTWKHWNKPPAIRRLDLILRPGLQAQQAFGDGVAVPTRAD